MARKNFFERLLPGVGDGKNFRNWNPEAFLGPMTGLLLPPIFLAAVSSCLVMGMVNYFKSLKTPPPLAK